MNESIKGYEESSAGFEELSSSYSAAKLNEWSAMDTTPVQRKGVWQSVYRSRSSHCKICHIMSNIRGIYMILRGVVPTQGKEFQALCREEITPTETVSGVAPRGLPPGTALFLRTGLELENRQCVLF